MLRSRPASKIYRIYSCVRVLGCAYAVLTVVLLKNYVLHCHDFVLHTGSPVRCILSLHCCMVVLVLVLFVCEGNVIVWLLLVVFMSNLEVVSELVLCGSSRFWGGRGVFMTGGFSQVCQRSGWGR